MPRRPVAAHYPITGDRASHARYGVGPASDYATPMKTPVVAMFDGQLRKYNTSQGGLGVALRGSDATFYGQHLWVRDRDGHYREGQRIALTGNSGTDTTGPHLHGYVVMHATGERLAVEEYLARYAPRPAAVARPITPPEEEEEDTMKIITDSAAGVKYELRNGRKRSIGQAEWRALRKLEGAGMELHVAIIAAKDIAAIPGS